MKPFDPKDLLPGDVMLYAPSDLVGYIIAVKTFAWYSHVEVYVGQGQSFGARIDGVKIWPTRVDKYLSCVRRPFKPFDLVKAMESPDVKQLFGSYQVSGFWSFFMPKARAGLHHNRICSVGADVLLKAGGVDCFNPQLDENKVAPAQFYQTAELNTIWENT
jgi:hypothetical protein